MIGVTIKGTWNRGEAPECLEIDPNSWYHVHQKGKAKGEDIRGRQIQVNDLIYMRGEWAWVSHIRWREE